MRTRNFWILQLSPSLSISSTGKAIFKSPLLALISLVHPSMYHNTLSPQTTLAANLNHHFFHETKEKVASRLLLHRRDSVASNLQSLPKCSFSKKSLFFWGTEPFLYIIFNTKLIQTRTVHVRNRLE